MNDLFSASEDIRGNVLDDVWDQALLVLGEDVRKAIWNPVMTTILHNVWDNVHAPILWEVFDYE